MKNKNGEAVKNHFKETYMDCFDLDGNGVLNEQELRMMITTFKCTDGAMNCPSGPYINGSSDFLHDKE